MRRGLYRIHGAAGRPDDVRVEDDGIELPLEETLYRARGYLPLVEELPWQEDYVNRKAHPDGIGSSDPSAAKAAREQERKAFLSRFTKR